MQKHSDLPKRVLIVEDEAVIACDLEDALRDAGFTPVGPALDLIEALRLVETVAADAAIVDAGMVQRDDGGLIQTLMARTIPFLFLTGYGSLELPANLPPVHTVLKPFHTPDLLRSLAELLEADGPATAPQPEATAPRAAGD
jgi:CheY-like chemotaxis protein